MRFEYFKNERTDTTYIRVNKTIARRAFNAGSCVIITPEKVNPNFMNGALLHYCNMSDFNNRIDDVNQYERVCNSIIYYNCNSELGKYLKYFLPKQVAIKYGYKG